MPTDEAPIANSGSPGSRGTIALLNRDLFFGVRIANTLRSQGYEVAVVPSADRLGAMVRETDPTPLLAIIDMAAVTDWTPVQTLASEPGRATPLLAFGPHKDVAAFRAAKAAGVDRVVSNGDFHRDMLGLVARYARPDAPQPQDT